MIETPKFIVADLMSKELVIVSPSTKAGEAASVMVKNEVSSLIVKDNGETKGIVTDSDFARAATQGLRPDKVNVSEIMTKDIKSIEPTASIQEAAEIIREYNIRHLLVKSSSDDYIGVISVKDLLGNIFEELSNQNMRLKKKIEELEKFYKIAVNRELVMVKLKKRINELEEKIGEKTDMVEYLVE